MITVEIVDADKIKSGGAEVEIFCDEAGLLFLRRQIDFLLGKETHVHFMTPAWAGNELSEMPLGQGSVINHLKITKTDVAR